jgi:hypothetical protein
VPFVDRLDGPAARPNANARAGESAMNATMPTLRSSAVSAGPAINTSPASVSRLY